MFNHNFKKIHKKNIIDIMLGFKYSDVSQKI